MHDLGNNFIRRGAGLPRTPPRKASQSNSDNDGNIKSDENHSLVEEKSYTQLKKESEANIEEEEEATSIVWPSRKRPQDKIQDKFSPREPKSHVLAKNAMSERNNEDEKSSFLGQQIQ